MLGNWALITLFIMGVGKRTRGRVLRFYECVYKDHSIRKDINRNEKRETRRKNCVGGLNDKMVIYMIEIEGGTEGESVFLGRGVNNI